MTDEPDNPRENDDELDAWLEALRSGGEDEDEPRVGQTIRKIVSAEQRLAEEAIDEKRLEHAKQRLMFRLKQERLISSRPSWQSAPMAMAASIAIVALVAVFTFSNIGVGPGPDAEILMYYGEVDRMRGGYPAAVVVDRDDPDADSRQLAERLQALGVPFELRADADEPSARILRIQNDGIDNPDDLDAVLRREGIDVPDEPVIVIRFTGGAG